MHKIYDLKNMSHIDLDDDEYIENEKDCETDEWKKQFYNKLRKKHGFIYAELIGPYAQEKYGNGWYLGFMKNLCDLSLFSKKFDKDTEMYGDYYPLEKNFFRALEMVKLEDIRCVIWGQDPYPQKAEISRNDETEDIELLDMPRAQGYSFGVHKLDKIPGSLKNIFKGIKNDYDTFVEPESGDMTYLSKEGVLFMNMCLAYFPRLPFLAYNIDKKKKENGKSVKKGNEKNDKISKIIKIKKNVEESDESDSSREEVNEKTEQIECEEFNKEKHTKKYMDKYMESWLQFSYMIIDILNSKSKTTVHMLWGGKAKQLKKMIKSKYILESSHPSNLANTGKASDPFKDNRHFLKCNLMLLKEKKEQINWNNPKLTKKKTDANKSMHELNL